MLPRKSLFFAMLVDRSMITPMHSLTHGIRWFRSTIRVGMLCGLISFQTSAQSVDLPSTHETYAFLERMEAKGYLTNYRDAIKPLSRTYIAGHIFSLQKHVSRMTAYEVQELAFLANEFAHELHDVRPDSLADVDRWRPVTFELNGGIMNLSPNVLVQTRRSEGMSADNGRIGFQAYGHAFRKLGFYLNFVTQREVGAMAGLPPELSPEQGIGYFQGPAAGGGYEYNYTEASLSYDFGGLTVAVEKTNNSWGEERYGNLFLSTKPPSYPKLKLRTSLTDWLDFTYIHAELHSFVVDSARSYEANTSATRSFFRTVYRDKYLAAHVLELSPWPWIDLTLGESVVYSDRGPLLIYLIPVMFFKSGEHYNRDTDNTQFFGAIDVRVTRGVALHGSMYIDEISYNASPSDPVKSRNQLGYAAGVRVFDLPVNNVELFGEYTRVNPWVYSHKFRAANFTSNGYLLGHWIGENADLATAEIVYRPTRASRVSVSYQSLRKGDTTDIANQYTAPAEEFLFGRRRTEQTLTVAAQYQFVRDAFIDVQYRLSDVTDERNPSASAKNRGELLLRLRYGLW